jgi:hypothetical protein
MNKILAALIATVFASVAFAADKPAAAAAAVAEKPAAAASSVKAAASGAAAAAKKDVKAPATK